MIRTHRLSLIPLTMQQLETGLESVKQLSVDMNLPIVSDILDGGFAVAARKKLTLMQELPPALHTWFTFWLIVLDCENIGIGMAGFKSVVRLGIIGRERFQYWKLFFWSLFTRPRLLPHAITLSIYGYHFRRVFKNHEKTLQSELSR